MKFWTVSIAILAVAAIASASGPSAVSTKSVTTKSSTTKLTPNHHGCVPEPISMLTLIPGAAMLIRRRKQAK